jgi:hypothetical protein
VVYLSVVVVGECDALVLGPLRVQRHLRTKTHSHLATGQNGNSERSEHRKAADATAIKQLPPILSVHASMDLVYGNVM